jgi:hypothetical protein
MIVVTHTDGSQTPLFSRENVRGIKSAEQRVSLLGEDVVSLSVQSATPIAFRLGDRIDVFGRQYTLNQLPSIKKTGEKIFEYSLTFEGVQYDLLDVQFLLPEWTVGESLTGCLATFVELIVGNANRVFPEKWSVGEYPDHTEYKTLTFSGDNCLAVLQNVCGEYGQEFEIEQGADGGRILHIRISGVTFPYTFRYGRPGGLYELTRENINSKDIVTRLYAYGGSSNVPSWYLTDRGSNRLCLPDKSKNASYVQDVDAIMAYGVKENTKTFEEIFPNRYGKVTARGSKPTVFVDSTMDFDLNEKDSEGNTRWLIADVNAKVHFNTGNLAGYEFDIHKYNHSDKTIEVVPFKDENGLEFPNPDSTAFQFAATDEYFFIDINLPDAYIIEAEEKLQSEAAEYYLQNSRPQVQYGLTIDENFVRQFAGEVTLKNLFAVGDYIEVRDGDIGVDSYIRITGFTRDLLREYKYSITLGESVTRNTFTRLVADQKELYKIIELNGLADAAKARRNWRDAQELLSMLDNVGTPALVYRGEYSSVAIYYGISSRVDAVKYDGVYYVARIDAGDGFTDKVPTDTDFWKPFGTQFESVATQLMLAEEANIAGWVFRNNRLETQYGGTYLDGSNGIIKGFIVNPYKTLGSDANGTTLDLSTGFNFKLGGLFPNTLTVYLPTDVKYQGAVCIILNRIITKNDMSVTVRVEGNDLFTYPRESTSLQIVGIVVAGMKLRLEAVPYSSTKIQWYIDNYSDFSEDNGDFILV